MSEDTPVSSPEQPGLDVVIVSGMSGAGRSTAAKCLEDLGFYVVDNLPPELIATMVDLGSRSQGAVTKVAVVVDVRSRAFSSDLRSILVDLDRNGYRPKVLFLEATERVLIRRFEAVRREHPLQGTGRLIDGIRAERRLLGDLYGEADLLLDTSELNVHQLRQKIEAAFGADDVPALKATVMSFGFKYGLPMDSDMVMDVRFLPNPHWIPELREHTGQEADVRDYVLSQDGAGEFLDRYHELLRMVGTGYQREGKRYLTLALGCTGGKHRSVVMAEQLSKRLSADGVQTTVFHRDLGRE
ncbi:MAG: RNase adapter RapZ [Geodermatophilaceae bacterium]|nr:RNase adapter RapZ [Geodermatophilaceae bacterium]